MVENFAPNGRMLTILRQIPLIALALYAIHTRLIFLQKWGPWLTPDTAIYFSTATNLVQGKGFLMYDGRPLAVWAPFYSMLLAAVQFVFGVKPFLATPMLNAVMFGIVIFLGGTLFLRHLKSPVLASVGTLSLVFSLPLFENTLRALSELPFIILLLLFLLLFELYQETPQLWKIVLAGLVVSLAALTRYVGVILIPVGIICIYFLTRGTLRERLRAVIVFTVSSLVFIGVWMVRNYALTRHPFGGPSSSPAVTFEQVTRLFFDLIFSWYAPNTSSATPIAFVIVGAVAGLIIGYAWRDQWRTLRVNFIAHGDLLIFFLCYSAIVVYQDVTTTIDPLNNRLMSPTVIPLHILILVFLEKLGGKLVPALGFQVTSCILAVAVLVWMPYAQDTLKPISTLYLQSHGIGWNTSYWNANPTIEYLKRNPLDCKIYSNAADVIWLQSEIPATLLTPLQRALAGKQTICVVLFEGIARPYTIKLEDLQKTADVVPIAQFKGGAIYRATLK